MTLEDIEAEIRRNPDPRTLFGKEIDATLKKFQVACHPDRYAGDPGRAAKAQTLFNKLGTMAEEARKPPIQIKSPKKSYGLTKLLGVGDVADVHHAISGDKEYVVKVSRVPEGAKMLATEEEVVSKMLKDAGKTHYDRYIPPLIESFPVRDKIQKRVNVFAYQPGFYTLEEVRAKYPRGLDDRHLAWIFKRLLVGIGFAHRCGFAHGSVLPCHVQIHAENHGLQLIGWGQSVKLGAKITSGPAKYMGWFPQEVKKKKGVSTSTDIFLAAQCMVYLAGGDPDKNADSPTMRPEMARFVRSCLLDGASMRPEDAWGLHDEFNDILASMYGPPKYHHLNME